MRKSFEDMATRMVNAEKAFVITLIALGDITKEEAVKVMAYYVKHKLVKLHVGIGAYTVKHGAFLDRDVIQRAVELTK